MTTGSRCAHALPSRQLSHTFARLRPPSPAFSRLLPPSPAFVQVRTRCIGNYNWSTDVVVVGDGDTSAEGGDETPRWRGFCAHDYNDDEENPATEYDRRPNLKAVANQPGWLQFSGVSYRLLLRREVL